MRWYQVPINKLCLPADTGCCVVVNNVGSESLRIECNKDIKFTMMTLMPVQLRS